MKVISKIHRTGNIRSKVFRIDKYDGEHKDICICRHDCKHFKKHSKENNCAVAQMVLELSKMAGIVLVHSCKYYEK